MLHTTITEDQDVRAAVTDFRDTVVAIRAHSARLIALAERNPGRVAEQAAIDDLVGGMRLRAMRLGLSLDDLFRLVNDDLRVSPPTVDHHPTGFHLRALEAEAIRARAAELRAHEAVTGAQQRLSSAIAARIAAQRACAGYVADLAHG